MPKGIRTCGCPSRKCRCSRSEESVVEELESHSMPTILRKKRAPRLSRNKIFNKEYNSPGTLVLWPSRASGIDAGTETEEGEEREMKSGITDEGHGLNPVSFGAISPNPLQFQREGGSDFNQDSSRNSVLREMSLTAGKTNSCHSSPQFPVQRNDCAIGAELDFCKATESSGTLECGTDLRSGAQNIANSSSVKLGNQQLCAIVLPVRNCSVSCNKDRISLDTSESCQRKESQLFVVLESENYKDSSNGDRSPVSPVSFHGEVADKKGFFLNISGEIKFNSVHDVPISSVNSVDIVDVGIRNISPICDIHNSNSSESDDASNITPAVPECKLQVLPLTSGPVEVEVQDDKKKERPLPECEARNADFFSGESDRQKIENVFCGPALRNKLSVSLPVVPNKVLEGKSSRVASLRNVPPMVKVRTCGCSIRKCNCGSGGRIVCEKSGEIKDNAVGDSKDETQPFDFKNEELYFKLEDDDQLAKKLKHELNLPEKKHVGAIHDGGYENNFKLSRLDRRRKKGNLKTRGIDQQKVSFMNSEVCGKSM